MTCKTAILIFPGTNREREMITAVRNVTMCNPIMIWHTETTLPPVDVIMIPGGFSYGDYLRPGAIAARSPIMQDVAKKSQDGVRVLGICNGFQILTEANLLPGVLMRNATLKFLCRNTYLRVERNDTHFTRGYHQKEIIKIPTANSGGNYFVDPLILTQIEKEGRIIFRYCNADGEIDDDVNLSGSLGNIAGIINKNGNILGMMPHPENSIDPLFGGGDGLILFESMLKA
ncbi:MAG: phosphoribosylformylglycinamidine synthase subunit PurQ [Alphaproteobacteria bacterium]|nr:phosphoribosylformylglycinamidine synthase subunit PurQ [Alphaproteobacteria bacterium]